LLNLGILEENIWVVELDDSTYLTAMEIIKHVYPAIKTFRTKIDNLFEVLKTKFDIVYLDYTAPFFSKSQAPYKTTMELYKYNIIDDFGVLITNYSEINPDDSQFEETKSVLHDYFYFQEAVHELEGYESGTWLENPAINEEGNFKNIVDTNYENLYSYFLTHFHLYLSEIITPAKNIFQNSSIKDMLFDKRELNKFISKTKSCDISNMEDFFTFGDKYLNTTSYWFEHFIDNIKTKNNQFYGYVEKENLDSFIGLINLLKEINTEEKLKTINKKTFEYVLQTQSNLLDTKGGYFCDMPMIYLWYSLLINQVGSPYHVNLKNHQRFKYTGNTRAMYVDIFTLDKCRYFYDWIPSIATLPETMLNVGKQILIRIIIDIIRKQHQFYLFDESYQYGNILCYHEDGTTFLNQNSLADRYTIKEEVIVEQTNDEIFEEMFDLASQMAKKVEENFCHSFKSFKNFHWTYTTSAHIWLDVKKVPDQFKVFGRKFTKLQIAKKYGFEYHPSLKQLYYRSKCRLNGSEKLDLMIHKTINSVFKRYGLECKLVNYPD
jgi:hypothetical protein